MADAKLTALTAETNPTDDDLLYTVDDPAGSPTSKKITWTTVKAFLKTYFDSLYYIVGGTDVAIADGGTGASTAAAAFSALKQAATTSASGVLEIATTTEVNNATDNTRAMTPDNLAGSNFGLRYVQAIVTDFATDLATGDGQFYLHIPAGLTGMNLVEVHAFVITAGTTGTTDIQIHNVTDAVDMLSTKLTIDSGETGSDTAATAAVINTATDDVLTNDVLRIDIDAVSTTAPKGLVITLGFRRP